MKKLVALALAVIMIVSLTACGKSGGSSDLEVTVNVASEPNSIDPAINQAVDGAMMINHMFEGLMKWSDDGDGNAILAPGQAESYEEVLNADGSITYTFKLRKNSKWSDGKAVVAGDFVYALQRLVDPLTAAEYGYMADVILNANDILAGTKDKSELAVKAIDDNTLEIITFYNCPYFEELLAFPALMPVRQDMIEAKGDQWTFEIDSYIGNGPMKMKEWVHNSYILMEPNEHYYEKEIVTVGTIKWMLMDDFNSMYNGFNSGELDFIEEVPIDEIPRLIEDGTIDIKPYIGTYYIDFNNQREPFTDPRVREAFSLVIDRNRITNDITKAGQLPADGFVPSGIYDLEQGSDFRANGGGYYSLDPAEYQANCDKARALLAEAGFPNGEGFPHVEYMYNTMDSHKMIGEALQNMWKTELGVDVTLNNQDWAVFIDTRNNHEYDIARDGWIADFNDPISFLDMFLIGNGNNNPDYQNPAYDALIGKIKSSNDQAERMTLMHEAEDMLMAEAGLAPIYFYTIKSIFNPKLDNMFYTPLGYFFFYGVTEKAA